MNREKFTRMTSDWHVPPPPPNKDIDKNRQTRQTADIGLVSSVGRAPARQSGVAGLNPALVNLS